MQEQVPLNYNIVYSPLTHEILPKKTCYYGRKGVKSNFSETRQGDSETGKVQLMDNLSTGLPRRLQ